MLMQRTLQRKQQTPWCLKLQVGHHKGMEVVFSGNHSKLAKRGHYTHTVVYAVTVEHCSDVVSCWSVCVLGVALQQQRMSNERETECAAEGVVKIQDVFLPTGKLYKLHTQESFTKALAFAKTLLPPLVTSQQAVCVVAACSASAAAASALDCVHGLWLSMLIAQTKICC